MRDVRRAAALLAAALLLGGCTADEPEGEPSPTESSPSSSGSPSATASPDASDEPEEPEEPGGDAGADTGGDTGGSDSAGGAPDGVLPTAEPVPLEETADFGTGVTSELAAVEAITAEAQGPGERSGPALSFTVELTNSTGAAVDLSAVTVNLTDDEGNPGLPMLGPPSDPFSGTLGAGDSVTGVYVFAVDEGSRSTVALEVSYSTQAPVVVFRGSPADV